MADYQPNKDNYTAEQDKAQKSDKTKKKGGCVSILINLVLIILAGALFVWGAMAFLKVYTRWGDAVAVPAIAGMSRAEAEIELRKNDLRMEIIDSVYVDSAKPGVVMDSNPREGAKVKSDRVIFVTVNANSARQITLPQVLQLSKRQAIATLKGAGFVNVTEKYVPGEFNELVLSVKDGITGALLMSGKRLPVNTPIVLEISSAMLLDSLMMVEDAMLEDSLVRSSGGIAPAGSGTIPKEPATPTAPATDPNDPDDWF